MNSLTFKALRGFATLVIALGILIFLPAWTFDYPQGWIYWSIFFMSSLWGTLYLLKKDPALISRRLKSGPKAEKEKSQKIIQAFSSILTILTLGFSSLDHRFGWSYVPFYISVITYMLVLVGYLIVFFVFRENSYAASVVEVSSGQKVITTGPYSIIRHPLYSGTIMMYVFSPLALGSYWGLIFSSCLFINVTVRLVHEEKFLIKNLPGYSDYMQNVRWRLIPYIW
jgi:protein-S-isoprenylcysteine O-methyltransferase Ste14